MKLYTRSPSGRYKVAEPSVIADVALSQVSERHGIIGAQMSGAAACSEFLIEALSPMEREVFGCLFLDNQHRIISFDPMFFGTINGTEVHPREIVKRALSLNAAAVILTHNHPSGNMEPSRADKVVTNRLVTALDTVDVRVLDHILVAGGETVSFANLGLV